MSLIPFHNPYFRASEWLELGEILHQKPLSGDGICGKQCERDLGGRLQTNQILLTSSCTHALEMSALLVGIKPGDEIILPAYTFVSTANPFVLRGAIPVFADSLPDHPNINPVEVQRLLSPKTKAVIVVHYGGRSCDMDALTSICNDAGVFLIEDAAHGIHASYKGKALGTFGDFGAFSFHDTKNLSCGEGGALVVKQNDAFKHAEIIREKGTNRSAFYRGEADFYTWEGIGSSYILSEIQSALLWLRLPLLEEFTLKRKRIWNAFLEAFKKMESQEILLPIDDDVNIKSNGHLFHIVCPNKTVRNQLQQHLKEKEIASAFHYQALHISPFAKRMGYYRAPLPQAEKFDQGLLRIPIYPQMLMSEMEQIIEGVLSFRPR